MNKDLKTAWKSIYLPSPKWSKCKEYTLKKTIIIRFSQMRAALLSQQDPKYFCYIHPSTNFKTGFIPTLSGMTG